MALTEDRVLESIQYSFPSRTVSVAWKDRILRDGVVVSEEIHRGAYPVKDDGTIDTDVTDLQGKTLKDVLGAELDSILEQNAASLSNWEAQLRVLQDVNTELSQQREQLTAELLKVTDQLAKVTATQVTTG